MKTKITILLISILLFVFAVPFSLGQIHNSKKLWSPPDNSFTVQVPVKLKPNDIYGNEVKTFDGTKSGFGFVVLILNLTGTGRTKLSSKKKLGGLEFVLGGDDDHEFTERYFHVEGLIAREVVYINQNKKGLMIDAGDKIFLLGLVAKNHQDLNSDMANSFFTSFHLLQKNKRKPKIR